MDLKIIPPESVDHDELQKELDGIEGYVEDAIRRAGRNIHFILDYERNNGAYDITIDYAGQGWLKNKLIKRMIKKAMKKFCKEHNLEKIEVK